MKKRLTVMITVFILALVAMGRQRGWSGIVTVLAVCAVLALLAGMLLPTLSKSKAKSQRMSAMSNLKQIGLATRMFANDNGRLPESFEEMMTELVSDKVLVDPVSGKRFVYVGVGKHEGNADAILAYSVDAWLRDAGDSGLQPPACWVLRATRSPLLEEMKGTGGTAGLLMRLHHLGILGQARDLLEFLVESYEDPA